MMRHLLTDIKIKTLQSKSKEYLVSDGDKLYLAIKPNGVKLWIFSFISPLTKKRRKTSFNKYPTVSLKLARERAEDYRQLLVQGIDPIDYYRNKKYENVTFGVTLKEYLEFEKSNVTKGTFKNKKSRLESLCLPVLEDTPIQSIEHTTIAKLVEKKAMIHPETASRILGYLKDLWMYAINKGYCKYNIITNIHKKSIIPKYRVQHYAKITDARILSELVEAIYSYRGNMSIKNALKFLLYIPLRIGTLVKLKWIYVDFESRELVIPRELMKVKDSNLSDFKLPLVNEVISILEEQYMFHRYNEYVFPVNGTPMNEESLNRALQRMGFNDERRGRKQRTHSFRGTFRSLAETHYLEHKIPTRVMEIVLDHVNPNKSEIAYSNRVDYTNQLKTLLEWWEGYLLSL